MGIFGKLFGGGKKDLKYVPSADPMQEDAFWDVIRASRKNSGGDPDFQDEALAGLLRQLPLQDTIAFQNRYHELRGRAYTWPLWGAAYIINGGYGDDSFCYFRDWLIAQGRDTYTKAVADPEWLAELDLQQDETDAEAMAYVAPTVFEERTGQELPAEFAENYTISGVEWQEEGDDLARMFPKLWNKYDRS